MNLVCFYFILFEVMKLSVICICMFFFVFVAQFAKSINSNYSLVIARIVIKSKELNESDFCYYCACICRQKWCKNQNEMTQFKIVGILI